MKIGRLRIHPTRRGWVIIAALALLASSYTADAVASVGRVRAGVNAGSLALGGKAHDEAERLLTTRAEQLLSKPVDLIAEKQTRSVAPSEIGFRPDVDRTLDLAEGIGRRGNVFVRIWHRVRALFASTDVGWISTYDDKQAKVIVTDFAANVDTEGHEAGIQANGATFVPVASVPGRRLDQDRAISAIVDGLEAWPRHSVELPISIRSRRTTIEDAQEAAKEANRWVRAPVTLTGPDGSRHFLDREELAKMIDAVPQRRGSDWKLRVRFSPDRVKSALEEEMKPFERQAKDASFAVNGVSVGVLAGQAGRTFDADATAQELAEAAKRETDRTASAKFTDVEPGFTSEQAKALNIKEQVSSFTTHHPCCQPRVANIHKMADRVNGAIVKPGASFSLNGHVGERTEAKGYVMAPMIFDGEFRDSVGGGVSQLATTMYNAIFYGGYRFNTYKAHSYYISRYPAGIEATVSWPHPDLAFTNNSKSGILIRTSYSNTSITVTFYGDKEGKVVTAEVGPRTNPTQPETQRKENPALQPGQEVVKQQGAPGFDIVVKRIIRQNGEQTSQTFFTKYKAQPQIVEFRPAPSPTPEEPPEDEPGEEPRESGEPRRPATPAPME